MVLLSSKGNADGPVPPWGTAAGPSGIIAAKGSLAVIRRPDGPQGTIPEAF